MSEYYIAGIPCSAELYHHGVTGQKWGRRRYQNEDGSLTSLGRIHYGYGKVKDAAKIAVKSAASYAKKGAKLTGKGIALVAKYGTYPIRRKHSWMLSEKEMQDLTRRYKAESDYLKAKATRRGESFVGKVLATTGDALSSGIKNFANETGKSIGQNIGKKFVDKLFETTVDKESKQIKSETTLYENKAALEKAKLGLKNIRDEYNNKKKTKKNESKNATKKDKEITKADIRKIKDNAREYSAKIDENISKHKLNEAMNEYKKRKLKVSNGGT